MRPLVAVCGVLVLAGGLAGTAGANTIVRFDTSLGNIDVELYDLEAPLTVANFLNYVREGDYVNSFFHRLVQGFVLQGGGFTFDSAENMIYYVPTDPPVVNEFDPSRSNIRGTIAMAKLSGAPNSATSQFFFNLDDNSADLDGQNGGFTVFGHVIGDGMDVVDRLAGVAPNPDNVAVWNASSIDPVFSQLPLIDYVNDGRSLGEFLETVYSVAIVLDWDGPTGSWTDPLWYDGNAYRSPDRSEAMEVISGVVQVDSVVTDLQTIASLSVMGGTVDITENGQLDVSGAITVDEGASLVVDGQLNCGWTVTSDGTISGKGTISAYEVFIGGTLSPGATAGAPAAASSVQFVPEPGTLVLAGMAILGLFAMGGGLRRRLTTRG